MQRVCGKHSHACLLAYMTVAFGGPELGVEGGCGLLILDSDVHRGCTNSCSTDSAKQFCFLAPEVPVAARSPPTVSLVRWNSLGVCWTAGELEHLAKVLVSSCVKYPFLWLFV